MSAKPGAYDDVASAYAEETSHRRLFGWHPLAMDRFNNRRASLGVIEQRHNTDPQAALIEQVPDESPAGLVPAPAFYRNPERIKRAAEAGGAANKARWEKIKALRTATERATHAPLKHTKEAA